MKKYSHFIFTALLTLCICEIVCCETERCIKLISFETEEPLAFRKLTFLPSADFTSSDENGDVCLDEKLLKQSTEIIVSGFALNDTIIDPIALLNQKTLRTRIKDHIMELVEINSLKLKPMNIGHKSSSLNEANFAIKMAVVPEKSQTISLDMKYGAWIKLPKAQERYVSKLTFHVGELLGTQREWVDIRILVNITGKKLDPFRAYPMQDFQDISNKPLNIEIQQSGWHELEFKEPIPIKREYKHILILFDLLRESDKFTISTTSNQREIQIAFYNPPSTISILDDNTESPALVVELLLSEKNQRTSKK